MLIEIFFIACYFIKITYKTYDKIKEIRNKKLIINLKKIIICLIFFNSSIAKLNILSPVELKMFIDKNIRIINALYFILSLYVFGYISFWGSVYFLKKNNSKNILN